MSPTESEVKEYMKKLGWVEECGWKVNQEDPEYVIAFEGDKTWEKDLREAKYPAFRGEEPS